MATPLLAGCTDETAATEEFQISTGVTVDPTAFLGDVPCSHNDGAMRSYVATVTDTTASFTLPSSPPTSCANPVSFRYVVPGHYYRAEIDGYRYPPDELEAFGGGASGSRTVLRAGEPVDPRWGMRCQGDLDEDGHPVGKLAVSHLSGIIGGCAPTDLGSFPTKTAVAVDISGALGNLGCEEVGPVDVTPASPGLPPLTGVPCSSPPVVYDEGVEPGVTYEFRLDAPSGPPAYGALCSAIARAGLTVTASCAPLSSTGTLEVDLDALACGEDVEALSATLSYAGAVGVVTQSLITCKGKLTVGQLLPADYEIDFTTQPTNLTAHCTVTVEAGAAAQAACGKLL